MTYLVQGAGEVGVALGLDTPPGEGHVEAGFPSDISLAFSGHLTYDIGKDLKCLSVLGYVGFRNTWGILGLEEILTLIRASARAPDMMTQKARGKGWGEQSGSL